MDRRARKAAFCWDYFKFHPLNMKIVLTNLSNKLYEKSRFQLNDSATKHGITNINSYSFEDLKSTTFYQQNQKILDQPKGIGYWAWKPYIILETMKSLDEGDIVIYSDCGIEIIEPLAPLIEICKKDEPVLLFANGNLRNKYWTKRDCFVVMNCDSEKYWNGLQTDAAFCLFKKSEVAKDFLTDWLKYCCDERAVGDLANTCGKKNFWGFQSHRWDQSILSLLAIKYEITLYRVPTQFGNHYKVLEYRVPGEANCINQKNPKQVDFYSANPFYNSPYFQLLNHHRSKAIDSSETYKKFSLARRWRKTVRWITRT